MWYKSPMKTLSIHQPWASLIALGVKRIENRSWWTHHRGPIAIHAAAAASSRRTWSGAVGDPAVVAAARAAAAQIGPHASDAVERLVTGRLADAPCSAVLAVVDLVDIHPVGDPAVAGDPFALGPYCWVLAHPRPYPAPIPAVGAQSLWRWDPPAAPGSPADTGPTALTWAE